FKYFKRKYNLFASVRRFMLLAYVVAIHPMIEITGVLAKGIKIKHIYLIFYLSKYLYLKPYKIKATYKSLF
ncbi:hypothetical protein ACV3Y3_10735, partial [Clostridium perfringens]